MGILPFTTPPGSGLEIVFMLEDGRVLHGLYIEPSPGQGFVDELHERGGSFPITDGGFGMRGPKAVAWMSWTDVVAEFLSEYKRIPHGTD